MTILKFQFLIILRDTHTRHVAMKLLMSTG